MIEGTERERERERVVPLYIRTCPNSNYTHTHTHTPARGKSFKQVLYTAASPLTFQRGPGGKGRLTEIQLQRQICTNQPASID